MTRAMGHHAGSAKVLAVASVLVIAAFVAPAGADDHRDRNRGGEHQGYQHGWRGGGYYPAPPVVYGYPGYYPPPVVYGPGVGIVLPGIGINIQ